MQVPQRRQPASGAAPANSQQVAKAAGRPLWMYFLPGVIIAVLVLGLVILTATQLSGRALQQANDVSARGAMLSMAGQLSAVVDARREQLRMLALLPQVVAALDAGKQADVQRAATAALKSSPDALQLRLFPAGRDPAPDAGGVAPFGYAGVDMVKRALRGKFGPAEVHQLATGSPYLALALPVRQANVVRGVLFGAWPLKPIRQIATAIPAFSGEFQLLQGNSVVLAGSGPTDPLQLPDGNEPVTGTIWSLAYKLRPVTGDTGSWVVLLVAGGGLAVWLLVLLLQYRVLGGDLRQDMASLVYLGEEILKRKGASARTARMAATRDAILLLTDYARQGRVSGLSDAAAVQEAPPQPPPEPKPESVPKQPVRPLPNLAPAVLVEELPEVPEQIFRAYDVRGVVDRDIVPQTAFALARAFAAVALEQGIKQVWVAHDARLSSPELYQAFCNGLVDQGMTVCELGLGPVALLYYAMHTQRPSAAAMITGSHNPPEYNGFKLYLDAQSLHGPALLALRKRIMRGGFESSKGQRKQHDLKPDYLAEVTGEVQLARPLRVVVDGGNGAAGELACELLRYLGCEVEALFCEPDGSFPNHHPDPGQPDNLAALVLEVQAQQADLGIAFDGDGDRLGVVDEAGNIVRPEHLVMLLAGDILLRHPGADVVYDVKSSRHLAAYILSNGGRPVMWCAGHARIKEKMRDTGALLGGEYSGHYFIKERWYGSDDALYVAARLVEVIGADPRPLSEILAELPVSPATPEYQLLLEEGEAAPLMQAIESKAGFADAQIIDIDGLRVEFNHGWGLVRPSNTVPSLTFRFEADSTMELEQIQQQFRDLIKQVLPDRQLPF